MAEDKKSSSMNLALILGVGNTAAIITSFIYMYRTMTSMQAQLTRLSDVVSTTILTVNEMKGESSKSKDIDSVLVGLDSEVREISADIQLLAANDNTQILKAQMFAIMDALKESGIEPEVLLQRYPQQFQYPGMYGQMPGMVPGMPQQGMSPSGMPQHMHIQGIPPHMHSQMQGQGMPPQMQQQQQMPQQIPQHMQQQYYNSMMSGQQPTNYINTGTQQHVSPLGRAVPTTGHGQPPNQARGRGRGRQVNQPPTEEEGPAPADIDREAVLRQMSSGAGRGRR